ncbi:MAG: hypothetical protein K6F27_11690 [Ruminococcus sp.]|nr:hypothetical protein [Ruminococcus sp.]
MTVLYIIIGTLGFLFSYCLCRASSAADEPFDEFLLDEEDKWLQSYYDNKKRS